MREKNKYLPQYLLKMLFYCTGDRFSWREHNRNSMLITFSGLKQNSSVSICLYLWLTGPWWRHFGPGSSCWTSPDLREHGESRRWDLCPSTGGQSVLGKRRKQREQKNKYYQWMRCVKDHSCLCKLQLQTLLQRWLTLAWISITRICSVASLVFKSS